jgi:type II secretion system protein I
MRVKVGRFYMESVRAPLLRSNSATARSIFLAKGGSRRERVPGSAGLTLLEVMVALCITAAALITCFTALEAAMQAAADARDSNRAVSLGSRLLAELQLDPAHPGPTSGTVVGPGGSMLWRRTIAREAEYRVFVAHVTVSRESAPEAPLYQADAVIPEASGAP